MKRVHVEIALGTFFVFLSIVLLTQMSVTEEDRLARYEVQQGAAQIEFGAAVFETNCTSCHGEYAQGIPGKAPCLRCEELFTTRLEDVGWQGSLEAYIISVVSTGRQLSTRPALYQGEGIGPPVMPTWSDQYDGPLRADQIRAVSAFIISFESWALSPEMVPTPVFDIPADDPTALGRLVFVQQGCVGCHTISGLSEATTGPVLDGLASNAGERVDGLSAEEYILQSIHEPGAYIVDGFDDGIMPQNFGELISEADFDNLLLFLLTLEE